jgi:biotin transporter BioY
MHSSTKHELLTAFQYLLIGIIAQAVVIGWFSDRSDQQKMIVWIVVALALAILRVFIMSLRGLQRRNRWMSISRRNW